LAKIRALEKEREEDNFKYQELEKRYLRQYQDNLILEAANDDLRNGTKPKG
jgi:hypothetical protein